MKPTPENLKILKILGFKRDHIEQEVEHDYFSLSNGWGFCLSAISNFPELMKRLYEGRAENIIDHEGIWKQKKDGYILVSFESEEEYEKLESMRKKESELQSLMESFNNLALEISKAKRRIAK